MTRIEHKPFVKFCEAYPKALRFTLLEKQTPEKFVGYHYPVKCKDFISDLFWSEHMGQETVVYDFQWTPKTFKLKEEGVYWVGLDMPDDDLHKYQENLTQFLNRWEKRFNLATYSVVSKAENGQLIVEFSVWWARVPASLSCFLLLCRTGLTYTQNHGNPLDFLSSSIATKGNVPYGPSDLMMVHDILEKKRFQYLWSGDWVFGEKPWSAYDHVYKIHNESGILNCKNL